MTTPYAFQEKAVRKIDRLDGRCLLAHDFGLGKSFMSLLWASRNAALPAIIVCPASLKWNWEEQASVHLNRRCDVLEGRKARRRKIGKHSQLLILNYDILHNWLDYIKEINPQLVILDEAHYLRNPDTLRTRSALELCRDVPNIIPLTGTPLLSRPMELFTTLNLLRPDIWKSRTEFGWRYCKPRLWRGRIQFKGAQNLPELHADMKKYAMCRCRKEDVLDQLPPVSRNIVLVNLSDQKEYHRAMKDFIGWLREKSPGKAKKARRAEFLVKAGYLKRLAAELKLPACIEWLENFLEDSEEKMIVFAHHKSVIRALRDKFPKISTEITGSTVGKKRQESFNTFLHSKRCRLLFGNLQAAGVGLSAKGVTQSAFFELGWTPADHTQAENRTHGIGRGREGEVSTSWWLIGRGTIEEKLCQVLQEKQGVVSAVLDGQEIDSALDIYDRLEEELLRETNARSLNPTSRERSRRVLPKARRRH